MGVEISDDVGFCIVFFLVVLSHFDCISCGVKCELARTPSEVGMMTPSEGCVRGRVPAQYYPFLYTPSHLSKLRHLSELSQPMSLLFSYLYNVRHNSVIE